MNVRAGIEHVFGVEAPKLRDSADIQWRALEFNPSTWNNDSSSCARYAQYSGRDDVIDLALAQRQSSIALADVFQFLVDAVIAAVPFRHESFLVEVVPPHPVWYCDNGRWSLANDSLFTTTRSRTVDETAFRRRLSRARWLFYLFPNGATWIVPRDIREAWRDDGSPTRDAILSAWDASPKSCGDTLGGLWGGYFTGGTTTTLAKILGESDLHPSAAVRSSARLIRELDAGVRGPIHDEIRSNLARYWKT